MRSRTGTSRSASASGPRASTTTSRPSLTAFEAETPTGLGRVRRFAGLFRTTLSRDFRMCPCGILAAEVRSLPADVVIEVRRFFALAEDWLEETLAFASDAGEILPVADTFRPPARSSFPSKGRCCWPD